MAAGSDNANEEAVKDVAAPPEAITANVAAASSRTVEAKKATVKAADKPRPSVERTAKSKDARKPQAGAAARESERKTAGQTRGGGMERPRRVGRSG